MTDLGDSGISALEASDAGGQSGTSDTVDVEDSLETHSASAESTGGDDPQLNEADLSPEKLPGPDDPQLGEVDLSPKELPSPPDPRLSNDDRLTEQDRANPDALVDARIAVDQAHALQDARAQVAVAYENGPAPLTKEVHNAETAAWADGYRAPTEAKQVEFIGFPQDDTVGMTDDRAVAVDRGGVESVENLTVEEAGSIEDARADLEARIGAGEVMGGAPVDRCELWHEQGHNERGYQNDCALASTAEVLQDCGVPASENDIVERAVSDGRCDTRSADPRENGGVYDLESVQALLADYGVDASVEHPPGPDLLAEYVDSGRGVVTGVSSAELWDGRHPVDPRAFAYDSLGRAATDHAVMVTGTLRDANGNLQGFVINDTGVPDGAGTPVAIDTWDRCWTNTSLDRETVVTTRPTQWERSRRA